MPEQAILDLPVIEFELYEDSIGRLHAQCIESYRLAGFRPHPDAIFHLGASLWRYRDNETLKQVVALAACYLHDLGKVREMEYEKAIDYSSEGRLVGHVVQGVEILDEFLPRHSELSRETVYRLKHLIVSHQGTHEFGSPKLPKTIEAIVFHHIDNLDAQIDGYARVLREGRETMGDSNWTGVNKLLGRNLYMGGHEE